jgi:hypothetical protein
LLNSEATTKWTSNGIVTATDSADVTGRCTNAIELFWHLNVDGKVLLLGLRQAKGAWDVVGDLQGREGGDCIAGLIHIALKGTSSIGIDLMNCDLHDGSGLDLGHTTSGKLVLGLLSDVDVAVDLGPTTCVDDVLGNLIITDDSSILLARGNGGTVASDIRVDWLQVS